MFGALVIALRGDTVRDACTLEETVSGNRRRTGNPSLLDPGTDGREIQVCGFLRNKSKNSIRTTHVRIQPTLYGSTNHLTISLR